MRLSKLSDEALEAMYEKKTELEKKAFSLWLGRFERRQAVIEEKKRREKERKLLDKSKKM